MKWEWAKANEKDLTRFVNENAIDFLGKLGIEDRLKLVQNPCGRRKLVKVIYDTLIQKGIRYDFEKYQPIAEIQRIRTPLEILSTPGEGTCLDLALLFCGVCFGYGLLPLLIVIEGHAFAAVSLKHKREEWDAYAAERSLFNKSELFQGSENLKKLQKFLEDEAYIAVECTGFAQTKSFSDVDTPETKGRTSDGDMLFERAIEAGLEQLKNPNRPFKFAIDIAAAQYVWKIEPLEIPKLEVGLQGTAMDAFLEFDNVKNTTVIGNENGSTGPVEMKAHLKFKNVEGGVIKGNLNNGKKTSGEHTVCQNFDNVKKSKIVGENIKNL